MKRIIMFVLLFAALKVAGQTTGYLRFDTVKIMKQNGSCELYIINKTKDSLGLLTNVGGGLTQFIKPKVLNDSTIVIGLDTLTLRGNGGGTPTTLSNVGSGFRWVKTPAGQVKTSFAGYGIIKDSTTNTDGITDRVDTSSTNHIVTQSDLNDAIAGAGSGISGLTAGRVTLSTSSTTVGDDGGLTYDATTNTVTTDSARLKNIRINEDPYNADSIRYHGTSITVGTNQTTGGKYTTLTSQRLNAIESNFGISGATLVTQGVANIPTLPVFNRAKYRWIVLEWGVNDNHMGVSLATFCAEYRKYIDTLTINRGWPANRIIILSPSYIDPNEFPTATLVRQGQFRDSTQAIASDKGCKWVDIHSLEAYRNPIVNLLGDGIHPNDYGAAIYASGIAKVTGDSVMSTDQNLSVNGYTELQRLKLRTVDTADYNSMPAGFDGYGNFVRFTKDQLIQNSTTLPYPQGASISLTGRGYFGNVTSPGASEVVQVNGMATASSLRATGSSPSGLTGTGAEVFVSGGVAGLMGYNRTGGAGVTLSLNQLGGQVVVNGASPPAGTDELFHINNGGINAKFGRFTGFLSGSGYAGSALELGVASSTAVVLGYDRTAGSGINLNLGFGLSTFVIVGSNSVSGSAPFQVNSTSRFSDAIMINRSSLIASEKLSVNGKINATADSADSPVNMLWMDTNGEIKKAAVPSGGSDGNGIYSGNGSLSGSTTITGAGNTLTMTGTQSSAAAFNVANTGNGEGISATTTGTGSALSTNNSGSGPGATFSSNSGHAVNTTTTTGTLFRGVANPSSTNTEIVTLRTIRQTSSTAATGMGQIWSADLEDDAGNNLTAVQHKAIWTSAAAGAASADYQLWSYNSGTLAKKFTIKPSGQLNALGYGSLTHTGTPVASLQVTSGDDVIVGPVLASGTFTPTLTAVSNTSSPLLDGARYTRIGNIVTFSLRFSITTSAGSTSSSIRVTLPVSSSFSNTNNAAGTNSGLTGRVEADATNDELVIAWVSGAGGTETITVTGQYTIL